MTAMILVWNPDEWNEWTYPAVLEEVAETGWFLASWELDVRELDGQDGTAAGGQAGSPAPARRRGSCCRAATGAV